MTGFNPHSSPFASLTSRGGVAFAVIVALAVGAAGAPSAASADTAGASSASARTASTASAVASGRLTNLAHLDFLLDDVPLSAVGGHTTYGLDTDPTVRLPWTYATALDDGSFERVGGGTLDPATGDYTQGAFNADDIARTAVVYLRDWRQTGTASSERNAYEVLRGLAYLQTASGTDAGNVVLWMQSDGTLNASAEPVELPDPSDSDASYWLARTIWAYGEGYAAFRDTDPAFARFLADRMSLAVAALDREVLTTYPGTVVSDGVAEPSWLIVDDAGATAEAVLGLAAYVRAAPSDAPARTALAELAAGIAKTGAGDVASWPYGALLPSITSRSTWHAWASQMAAGLAAASGALGDRSLLAPAVADSAGFDPTMLAGGGPDSGWSPVPVNRGQIAYGADSRVESLFAVSDATGNRALADLAGLQASWFFGANASGAPVYDPATGVTRDGVEADGRVNPNSGAESTIHGLLTMLALDAHPDQRARAAGVATVASRDGLTVIEGEAATRTTGAVETHDPASTAEYTWSGGASLLVPRGGAATWNLGPSTQRRVVEPVVLQPENGAGRALWFGGYLPLGLPRSGVGAQGVSPVAGALLPETLLLPVPAASTKVSVLSLTSSLDIDALLVRPVVSRLVQTGAGGRTELAVSASRLPEAATVGSAGVRSTIRIVDAAGRTVSERSAVGPTRVTIPTGGFALALG